MRTLLSFTATALKNFSVTRSVVPTSKIAVDAITNTVCKTHREARNIIMEYGAGDGRITKALLEPGMLKQDGKLIAIEIVKEFADKMKRAIDDDRLKIMCADAKLAPEILLAQDVQQVDQVFSGIPFSIWSKEEAETIIRQTYDMLNPGGVFVVYQVKRDVEKLLHEHFDQVSKKRVWWNFPPLYLFVASKKKTAAPTL